MRTFCGTPDSSFPRYPGGELANHILSAGLPTQRTSLDGITELLPGTGVSIDDVSTTTDVMWSPWDHVSRIEGTSEDLAATLRETIKSVIASFAGHHERMLIGVSGGLDSSIVASCLGECGSEVVCLTAVTGGPSGDERSYARMLCDALGLDLMEAWYELADVDIGRSAAPHLPRPMSRTQSLAYDALVARAVTSRGATAFFTGNGGDNAFGYSRSAAALYDRFLSSGYSAATLATLSDLCRLTGCSPWQAISAARRIARRTDRSYPWKPEALFLHSDVVAAGVTSEKHPWLDAPPDAYAGKAAHIAGLLRIQPHLNTSEQAIGVPIVNPLMAQPILETCLRFPSWEWCRGGVDRAVARTAFESRLPDAITQRRTKGSPDSFCIQIIDRDRSIIRERLLDGRMARHNLLDLPAIEQTLSSETPNLGFEQVRLLTLLEVEAWLDHWTDGADPLTVPIPRAARSAAI